MKIQLLPLIILILLLTTCKNSDLNEIEEFVGKWNYFDEDRLDGDTIEETYLFRKDSTFLHYIKLKIKFLSLDSQDTITGKYSFEMPGILKIEFMTNGLNQDRESIYLDRFYLHYTIVGKYLVLDKVRCFERISGDQNSLENSVFYEVYGFGNFYSHSKLLFLKNYLIEYNSRNNLTDIPSTWNSKKVLPIKIHKGYYLKGHYENLETIYWLHDNKLFIRDKNVGEKRKYYLKAK